MEEGHRHNIFYLTILDGRFSYLFNGLYFIDFALLETLDWKI